MVEQWLTLYRPVSEQGHWHLHQLLFLPRAAPKHRRQYPYAAHSECLSPQDYPQPPAPALTQEQDQDALPQGPWLDAAAAMQPRGRGAAYGTEPDRTNGAVVAWAAACLNLARDRTELRQYKPEDRMVLASTETAVTMGPVVTWP